MIDFRRWILALAVLTPFAGLASAQVTGNNQLTCATNVSVTPSLRAQGYTEQTGDITLTCTGGFTTVPGAPIPQVDITVFLTTAVTSRLLPISGGNQNVSEALLLIDEPGSGLAGYGPSLAQKVCPTPATGCLQYVGTQAGVTVGTAVDACTTFAGNTCTTTSAVFGANVFQGIVSGNSVTWHGIPVLPPVFAGASRVFRFTNIRANATSVSDVFAAGSPPVLASISISGATSLPMTNPTPTVGFVLPGLLASVSDGSASLNQCATQTRASATTLSFREGFGTAFKTRVSAQNNNTSYAGQGFPLATGNTQNVPGAVYNSESNFVLGGMAGGETAGLADFGTRLKATFNNVPAGVRLFVSIANVFNNGSPVPAPPVIGGSAANTCYTDYGCLAGYTGYALLVNGGSTSDGNAAGGFFPAATATDKAPGGSGNVPVAEIPVVNGSATAVWEVVNTNPNTIETLKFGVYTTYTSNVANNSPPPGTATVNLSFAPAPPAFSASSGAASSSSLTIPRFADTSSAANVFSIAFCYTAPSLTCSPVNAGEVGVAFNGPAPTVSGSSGPFTFSMAAGTFPAGLTLNTSTGAITGTPTAPGAFIIQVRDATGVLAAGTCPFTFQPAPSLTLTCPAANSGQSGTVFSSPAMTVSGGTGPFSFSVATGTLLAGLRLNGSTGAITGTPAAAGSFAVQVKDAAGALAAGTCPFTFRPAASLICPAANPGQVGTAFSSPVMSVSGGTGPFTFSVATGTLLAGLSLNGSTGAITGTATAAGSFAVQVRDGAGALVAGTCPFTFQTAISLTCPAANSGQVGTVFSSPVMAVSGGTGPFNFSVATGTLLAGLSLNGSTGAITGTPTAAGSFAVQVKDVNGLTAGATCRFTIASPLRPTSSVTLAANPNTPSIGQPVTLIATVGTDNGAGSPRGTVGFLDGTTMLGAAPVTGGQARFVTSTLSRGSHSITANYTGDSTYPAASTTMGLYVTQPPASLNLTSNLSSTVFGQPITLTASLESQSVPGIAAPTGQVQFFAGGCCGLFGSLIDRALIGTAELSNGVATITVTKLAADSHQIVATYSGDANWSPASSNAVTQTVGKAATRTTWKTVSSDSSQATLAANVTVSSPGSGDPTGMVQFLDTGTNAVVAIAPLVNGSATATILSSADLSKLTLLARYAGDSNFAPGTSGGSSFITVTDAAGQVSSTISPDEIAAIFGAGFVDAVHVAGAGPLPGTLSGVTAQVTDSGGVVHSVPLLLVSPAQINAVVPAETALGPALVTITSAAGVTFSKEVVVTRTAPGLFAANGRGAGVAAAQVIRVRPDGSLESQNTAVFDALQQRWVAVPIGMSDGAVYVQLSGTGIRHRANDKAVTCSLNGRSVNVLYSGASGGASFPGLDQVNIELPLELKGAGSANVTITVEGRISNTVTLMLQ